MKWDPALTKECIYWFKQGLNDASVLHCLKVAYPNKSPWTVHAIRSKRGRLERSGLLKRGVAGSSVTKKETSVSKKIKRELWTKEATNEALHLRSMGQTSQGISRSLRHKGLRKDFNPEAVYAQLRKVDNGTVKISSLPTAKKIPEQLPLPKPAAKSVVKVLNTITLDGKLGYHQYVVDDETLADINDLCVRCKLGLDPGVY
jgi:hypothetical protein